MVSIALYRRAISTVREPCHQRFHAGGCVHTVGLSPLSPTHTLLPYRLPYYLFAAQANFPSSLWNSTERVWASLFCFFFSLACLSSEMMLQWCNGHGWVMFFGKYIYLSVYLYRSWPPPSHASSWLWNLITDSATVFADHLLLSGQYGGGGSTKWLSQVRAVFLGSFTP